jgi:hypothetical protein
MIEVHNGCIMHFFACSVKNCKTEARGVWHYQDKGDKSLTANLCHHAVCCFGKDVVNATTRGRPLGARVAPSSAPLLVKDNGQLSTPIVHIHHLSSSMSIILINVFINSCTPVLIL